eukprot:6408619-Ditylum_brightwellii.AAC.1
MVQQAGCRIYPYQGTHGRQGQMGSLKMFMGLWRRTRTHITCTSVSKRGCGVEKAMAYSA